MSPTILTFRRDFAQHIRDRHDVTLAEARAILGTLESFLISSLEDGKPVRLGEIGILLPSLVKARKRYHQVRGKVVSEPAHRTLKLRVSPGFKKRFAKGKEVAGKLRSSPRCPLRVSKDCTSSGQTLKPRKGK